MGAKKDTKLLIVRSNIQLGFGCLVESLVKSLTLDLYDPPRLGTLKFGQDLHAVASQGPRLSPY